MSRFLAVSISLMFVTISYSNSSFAQQPLPDPRFNQWDKNKDGNISYEEVPPAQFQTPVWLKTNLNGDMFLSWEEELIWQYNVQKKKAGKK